MAKYLNNPLMLDQGPIPQRDLDLAKFLAKGLKSKSLVLARSGT